MKIESLLNLRWSYRSLMTVVFLVTSSSLFSQQLRIAQTFEDVCSPFYNGVATIGDRNDDCYYIDRLGNNLGKAPGQLIFATKSNRVFKSYNREDIFNEMFITDLNDNIISRRYSKIKEFGGYFFCEIDCSAREPNKIDILNFKGEIVFSWKDSFGYFFTFGNSDFIELSAPDKNKLFYKGEIIYEDNGIERMTFGDNWPLVISSRYAYNKKTRKLIDIESKTLLCQPYIDFYIIIDSIGKRSYYDYNDKPINISLLNKSSKGVKVQMDSIGHYSLVNKYNRSIEGMFFEDVDPFLWQSDYLAVKRDGKWGYVKSDGTIHVKCIDNFAGPVIMGHSYVELPGSHIKAALLNIETLKYIELCDAPLKRWFFNKIDDHQLFYYRINNNTRNSYGFTNLDGRGMQGTTFYPEFIDGFTLSHYYQGNDLRYIAFDINAKVVIRAENGLKRIGKNLFVGTFSDKYNQILFNEKGDTLIDLSKSELKIQGPLSMGLIPFSSPGGAIKYNGNEHSYGYLYDTFTQTQEQTIAQYGVMGNRLELEDADNFLSQRIELMDYYQILGNHALESGKYNLAIDYFDKMIDLYTVTPTAFFGKGIAYINLGDYKEALRWLDSAFDMPSGTEYAKAICYFNMGKLDAARNCCYNIGSDDPFYEEALQMRREILKIRQNKSKSKKSGWDKAIAILGAISNGLQLFSQSMNAVNAPQQGYVAPSSSYNSYSATSATRKTCSFCHGTGLNSAKERPAFYSYAEETYSNSPCEVCGGRDNHYHKPCPSCMGKGYVNY